MSSSYDNRFDNNDHNSNLTNNLIVNYLPQTLTDNEFKKIFERIGPIIQAKIIRNKTSSYSYGFGFVEYVHKMDAERAIETLNGMQLKNKRMKVAWSRPCTEDKKKAKLYIKNVVPSMGLEKFNQLLAKYGEIIQSNIVADKGIAFVLYDKREQAENAISNLQGITLAGSNAPLEIKFASSSNGTKFQNNNPNQRQMRPYNHQNHNNYNNNNNYNYENERSSRNDGYYDSQQEYGDYSGEYSGAAMHSPEFGYISDYQSTNPTSNTYGGPVRNGNKTHHTSRYNPMNNSSSNNHQSQYDYNNDYYPSAGERNNFYQFDESNYSSQNYHQNYHHHQNYDGRNSQSTNSGHSSGQTIFVYNIGPTTGEDQLYNIFSKYGQVTKVNVLRRKNLLSSQWRGTRMR